MNVRRTTTSAKRMTVQRPYGPPIWLPLALLLGLSVVFRVGGLDLKLQRLFWSTSGGWFLDKNPLIQLLYHYGTWPALALGGIAAAIWLASRVAGRWQSVRSLSLFLALVLIAGPGILVNVIFKDHFNRSRPRQTQEFGGDQPFRQLGEPGFKGGGKSFPAGHASTGFYWLALLVYFWDRQRNWAWGFGALGICHGLLMGLGRMAQGGHWASDVLWAGGLVYLTAWLLYGVLFRFPKPQMAQSNLVPASAI